MKQLIFLSLMFFLTFSTLFGQVPQNLSYQGLLTDTNGEAMNGNFDLTFKLYTAETSASSIWEESQNYLYRVQAGSYSAVRKAVFVK